MFYVADKVDSINMVIYTICNSLPIITLVLLKKGYLLNLFESFQNILSLVLTVSAFFWILHLIGIDLPYTELYYGEKEGVGGAMVDMYYFHNHYLYLVDQSWMMDLIEGNIPSFLRFSSVFLEPGYLAILMCFLLFINEFNFKDKRNIVYLITLLLTISLAGLIMGLFAYIAHILRTTNYRLLALVGVFVLALGFYAFFSTYNNGNNIVNEMLLSRLELDQEKGIVGNNRTSSDLDLQFKQTLESTDIVFGIGDSTKLAYGVGYKPFIIKNGLFGLFLFLFYIIGISRTYRSYRSTILCILYILMFYRGHVTMFWSSFMLVYIAGVLQTQFQNKYDIV